MEARKSLKSGVNVVNVNVTKSEKRIQKHSFYSLYGMNVMNVHEYSLTPSFRFHGIFKYRGSENIH